MKAEMSVAEIAGKLGCSKDSVRTALRRALKKLRDGRAEKCRDLMIARDREQTVEIPTLPDRISTTMRNGW